MLKVLKVNWRKPLHSNRSILAHSHHCSSIRRDLKRVHWAEVSLDLSEVLASDQVEDSSLKRSTSFTSQRHIFGVLSSSHKKMELFHLLFIEHGVEESCSNRVFLIELLEDLQSHGIDHIALAVIRASSNHGEVFRECERKDFSCVKFDVFCNFHWSSMAYIILVYIAVRVLLVECGNVEELIEVAVGSLRWNILSELYRALWSW